MMQMKRVLGIGTASLILATASVFGGTAAHAGVMKASHTYHPTLTQCEKYVRTAASVHRLFGYQVVKAACVTVRPSEKYMGVVTWIV
ncbi:MAG TPA: hypothetical protein GX718_06005 [Brevibacterium sp.]|nr:hypothetical protein [Brevibacterium sp.]